jgi:hypothetical protein
VGGAKFKRLFHAANQREPNPSLSSSDRKKISLAGIAGKTSKRAGQRGGFMKQDRCVWSGFPPGDPVKVVRLTALILNEAEA